MQTTANSELPAPPPPGRYTAESGASTISFKTRHMFGLGPVSGRFPVRSAVVDVAEPLTESTVKAEIDAAGLDTGNTSRDRKVRSKAFLNVAHHPAILFEGAVTERGTLQGTLTVCDVSKPVELTMEQLEAGEGSFTARATCVIDRMQFGVTAYRGLAGRHLALAIDIRCALA